MQAPFNRSDRVEKIEGLIGYFGLTEWWLATFTQSERDHIEAVFQPVGIGIGDADSLTSRPLTRGRIGSTTETVVGLLSALAGWFNNPEDRHIAQRLLVKAEGLGTFHDRSSAANPSTKEAKPKEILDLHFTYQGMIETFYRDRQKDPSALGAAIDACEKQIAMATAAARAFESEYIGQQLPIHIGFKQLAIMREKQGRYLDAIQLCREALRQGWDGDWQNRIERCEAKLRRK